MLKLTIFHARNLCILLAATLFANLNANAEDAIALISGNILWRFNLATPNIVTRIPVTGLGGSETLRGIDFRPANGTLVGSTVGTGTVASATIKTYSINVTTGAATLIGSTNALAGAADVPTGYDFNPSSDRIRYINSGDENLRVNPNNGTLTGDDPNITPAVTTTVIAAAYDRSTAGTTLTTLFVIDRNDDALGFVGGINGTPSPNGGVVTEVGALGIVLDGSKDGGFDILSTSSAYAGLSNIGTGITGLYTIDLTTGAATLVGAIGDGATEVYSMAVVLTDTDQDGVRDTVDNCPTVSNADQGDLDSDGTGNVCDADKDGDGLSDAAEAVIGSDPSATDSDGDTHIDGQDACPILPANTTSGCPSVTGTAPETTIDKAPSSSKKRSASITFSASVSGSVFECSLDNVGYRTCTSPKRYRSLRVGRHTFKVRGISTEGIIDLTPASATWKVKR